MQSPAARCAEVALLALGVPIAVRLRGDRALDAASKLRQAWDRCLADGGTASATTIEAFIDDDPALVEEAVRGGAIGEGAVEVLLHRLSSAVTMTAIDHLAGTVLLLHGAVLADPVSGRAVVLVGPSGMGKTTLARTLGSRLGYVTDETVAIEEDGSVRLYPKPLSVKQAEGRIKAQRSPTELGLVRPQGQPHAARIVLLDRHANAPEDPVVEEVDILPALALLAEHTSHLSRLHRPLHQLADILATTGGLYRLSYRDADDLLPLADTLVRS